jgi:hypothetical protein
MEQQLAELAAKVATLEESAVWSTTIAVEDLCGVLGVRNGCFA